MTAAARLRRDVTVPTVILAELYRGGGRNQMIDSLLSRETEALELRDTDRVLARLVGGVLAAAGAGSEDLADAHVVATAIEAGGGVILTVDVDDLTRLADPYRTIVVERLASR
jgi:predicted nucleic acid-binding protein